eukprot:TRINITY_DN33778_c0_g1_i3.p1 TRINITY_DN33778_c0_g1~~TRINITY_DN33778_c0_g1_i3.p1  ORF type:complete len:374 (+),score=116.75 TRINITY_DN33778_c0_g1_i3:89-1123(+)
MPAAAGPAAERPPAYWTYREGNSDYFVFGDKTPEDKAFVWKAKVDKSSGRTFYANRATGARVWHLPELGEAPQKRSRRPSIVAAAAAAYAADPDDLLAYVGGELPPSLPLRPVGSSLRPSFSASVEGLRVRKDADSPPPPGASRSIRPAPAAPDGERDALGRPLRPESSGLLADRVLPVRPPPAERRRKKRQDREAEAGLAAFGLPSERQRRRERKRRKAARKAAAAAAGEPAAAADPTRSPHSGGGQSCLTDDSAAEAAFIAALAGGSPRSGGTDDEEEAFLRELGEGGGDSEDGGEEEEGAGTAPAAPQAETEESPRARVVYEPLRPVKENLARFEDPHREQ